MNNNYITAMMDGKTVLPRQANFINRVLARFGATTRLINPWGNGRMCQRMNLFHLLSQTLAYKVPGDVVELGPYLGQSAALLAKVMAEYEPERELHVYDAFLVPHSISTLKQNFQRVGAKIPGIHTGWIQETVPSELPEKICFAHIDVGSRISPDLQPLVHYCLEHIYPRLAEGGICVLQSYCDPAVRGNLSPYHRPAVKAAADEFFRDKPEEMYVLYAGDFLIHAHGYFRKQAAD
ncbi:MAG: O-methyltransferase [Halioglobus sp.]|jgi:O-methyltransferase